MTVRALFAVCIAVCWSLAAVAELTVGADVTETEAAVARALVHILDEDDPACLVGMTDISAVEVHLRDFLERYERPRIHAAAVYREAEGLLRLELDGDATTAGALQRVDRVPTPWLVQVDGQGRLVAAETATQFAARQLVEAADDAERRAMLAGRTDLRDLAFAVAIGLWRRPAAGETLALLLETSRAAGDTAAEAECLRLQALRDMSAERGAQSLEVARGAGDAYAEARALFSLGMILALAGHDDDAITHMAATRATIEHTTDAVPALKALHMAAHIELRRGRLAEATGLGQETLALSRRFAWRDGEATALLGLQSVHTALRQHDVAASIGQEAYRVALASGLRLHAAMAAANVAQDELGRRDYAAASRFATRALGLSRFVGAESRADIYMTVARIHAGRQRFEDAEAAAREAVRLASLVEDTQILSDALVRLADVLLARGRAAEALDLAERARELGCRVTPIGSGYVSYTRSAAPGMRGRALLALGREDEAIEALQEAVASSEEDRSEAASDDVGRAIYFEDKIEPYRQLVAVLARRGRTAGAFRVAQMMKGRTLTELVHDGRREVASAMSEADRARERELESELMQANRIALAAAAGAAREDAERELTAARVALRRFRSELHGLYAGARTPHVPARVEAPRGAAIVDYVVTPSHVIAFAITAAEDGSPHVRVVTTRVRETELRARIESALRRLQNADPRYATDARELYRLLIAPLPRDVLAQKALCIVPDGVLWQVPFHALAAPDGRYLVERTAVFYAPSAAMLQTLAARRTSPNDLELLAFANPVVGRLPSETRTLFGAMNLGSLPESESEVNALRRLYGPSRSRVYLGAQARESRLKREAARSRILHIATHGFADPQAPMFSALLLAPAGEDDGVLEAREIAELDLNAELAVLSACETARGAITAGEGVIGLAWAFLGAGVPTTVVSQWKASSRATEALMVAFHRHLVRGDPPAEALRKAQLALMKDERYRAPFYWAAFTVVGAGSR